MGPENSAAHEFMISYGGGEQAGSDQSLSGFGVDYSFLKIEKSQDQHRLIGSYTRIESDTDQSLLLCRGAWTNLYIDQQIGDRKQKNYFAFQAQVGVGVYFKSKSRKQMMVMHLTSTSRTRIYSRTTMGSICLWYFARGEILGLESRWCVPAMFRSDWSAAGKTT